MNDNGDMLSENEELEGDGDTCYGSQNLFSSQSSSLGQSQNLEVLPPNKDEEQSYAIKAVLQMLELYHHQLQKAQAKARKQMEWVVVGSTENFPANAISLVTEDRDCGVLATQLPPLDPDKDSEDGVATRVKRDRRKPLTVKPKVSKIFQFKVNEEDNLLSAQRTDSITTEPKVKDSSKLNLIGKGTSWLKSKIGLKRKKIGASDSEDDILEEGDRKKVIIEKAERNQFQQSRRNTGEENIRSIIQTKEEGYAESVQEIKSARIRSEPEKSNQYSTVDLDGEDEEDEDFDQMPNTKDAVQRSTKSRIIDIDSDGEETVVHQRKASLVQKRPADRSKTKVSCPICQREFSPLIINDHAFTCNGDTEPREKRTQNLKRKEDGGSSSVSERKFEKSETTSLGDGKAFARACSKVVVDENRARTEGKRLGSFLEGDVNCPKKLPRKEIPKCEEVDQPKPELTVPKADDRRVSSKIQLNEGDEKENKTERVNSFYSRKKKDNLKPKVAVTNVSELMSEDSDDRHDLDTTDDILHQYLMTSPMPLKGRQASGISRVVEGNRYKNVDKESSSRRKRGKGMEKCFICGKSFPSGETYRKHVEEEMDKMEGRNYLSSKEEKTTGTKSGKEQPSLQTHLGNRASWTRGNLVERQENTCNDFSDDNDNENIDSGTIRVGEVSDSPIKGFKFIDENSDFDFQGQFQSNGKEKKVKARNYTNRPKFRRRRKKVR